MKEMHSVFTSDALNLNLHKFSTGSLVRALSFQWDIGIPTHVSHDLTRLVGWARPTMVYFEPGLTRLAGVNLIAETEEEMQMVNEAQRRHITQRILEKCTSEKLELLKTKIGKHLNGNEIPYGLNYVALRRDGLAKDVFKELFNGSDKDGLIPTTLLNYVGFGLFEKDGLLLFPHPWFRRSNNRLNNLNSVFIDQLFRTLSNHKSEGRIALDTDLVGLAGTEIEHMEHEYWWGPKFSDDISSIPPGVTRHQAEEYEHFFYNISATEFWWQSRDNEHIFEVEELRDSPMESPDSIVFGCRYVHSIVNETTGTIQHLDGAIRSYPEDAMIARLDSKINQAGRHSHYTKLWRLDAPIKVAEWKRLISDYFRDNHLIGEYFGINPKEKAGRPVIISQSDTNAKIRKYVRYSLDRGQGVRIAVSFHSLTDFPPDEPTVVPLDRLTMGDTKKIVVPSDTLELKKACLRSGLELGIPNGVGFIAFEDLYTDLPLVKIPRRAAENKLRTLINGLRQLVQGMTARSQDRVVSYSIGIPLNDREFRLSVLGEVHDLELWLNSPLSFPPSDLETIFEWADAIGGYLQKNFKSQHDSPKLSDIFKVSGILFLERTPIQSAECHISYSEKDRGLVYDLRIPKNDEELANALESNRLSVSSSFLIHQSVCSRCHLEYRDCPCSKYLDKGVIQKVTNFELAFPYFTDRPAAKTFAT